MGRGISVFELTPQIVSAPDVSIQYDSGKEYFIRPHTTGIRVSVALADAAKISIYHIDHPLLTFQVAHVQKATLETFVFVAVGGVKYGMSQDKAGGTVILHLAAVELEATNA